jgi:hypothetical protein
MGPKGHVQVRVGFNHVPDIRGKDNFV